MTTDIAVCDSSPLIIFWQINRLELLSHLFADFAVPTAVRREVAPSVGALPTWIQEHQAPTPPAAAARLDAGEREVIALAREISADFVVLDDLAGRREARRLGLDFIGSVGLLLRAREVGLIRAVRPDLDAMVLAGLYISPRLYNDVLAAADEPGA